MAENSKIEWTDATWNPVVGCSVHSAGCTNCYAMRMAARLEAMGQPMYQGLTKKTKGGAVWTGKVGPSSPAQVNKPLTWRKPRRIFVNSMSDLFHEDMPESAIAAAFNVMAQCPQHTFQVLTKRAAHMRAVMCGPKRHDLWSPRLWHRSVLPNMWLGTSVENRAALHRIDDLRTTPAAVRFISFEPLLEDLGKIDLTGIHQAITGGESGPKRRPHDVEWQRSILRQCRAQGVAFFGKQDDKVRPLPDDLMIRQFPSPSPPSGA